MDSVGFDLEFETWLHIDFSQVEDEKEAKISLIPASQLANLLIIY